MEAKAEEHQLKLDRQELYYRSLQTQSRIKLEQSTEALAQVKHQLHSAMATRRSWLLGVQQARTGLAVAYYTLHGHVQALEAAGASVGTSASVITGASASAGARAGAGVDTGADTGGVSGAVGLGPSSPAVSAINGSVSILSPSASATSLSPIPQMTASPAQISPPPQSPQSPQPRNGHSHSPHHGQDGGLSVSDNNLTNYGEDMAGVEALAAAIPECK